MQGLKKSQLKNQTFVGNLYGKTEQKRKKKTLSEKICILKREKELFYLWEAFSTCSFTGLNSDFDRLCLTLSKPFIC